MIKINIGSPILSSSKLEKNLMQKKEKKIIPIILQNKKLIKYHEDIAKFNLQKQ